jgi:sulfur-carrier protein
MSEVSVRLASALRPFADGKKVVPIELDADSTLAGVLDRLSAKHPEVGRRIRDEQGAQRIHVNIFVDEDNARDLEGLATPMRGRSEVWILPAVSGG